MSLLELVAAVEAERKTLYVNAADEDAVDSVERAFADRNLRVVAVPPESGPPEFAMLTDGDDVLSATSLSSLVADDSSRRAPGFEADPYRPILDELDETFFTSYDAAQMLAASREIEDRAWRTGSGRLYAGFQTYSVLEAQLPVYEQLGAKSGLDVAALAAPDGELPPYEETFAVCGRSTPEVRTVWFVAFDGGPTPDDACALVAEERDSGRFYGFWTYDPDTVDDIFDYVTDRYLGSSDDTPSSPPTRSDA